MIGSKHRTVLMVGALLMGAWRALDIILHLGAHRTASTSFQSYLSKRSNALDKRGIAVWAPERTRSGLFSGLVCRPEDRSHVHVMRGVHSSGLIRSEASRLENAGTKQLLVSEENMIGAVRDNLRQKSLYPSVAARLERFRAGFGDKCTRIGLAIRDYEGYWSSSLAFAVARGHRFPSRCDLNMLALQPRRWRDVIGDVARTFPNAEIVVWPFEKFAARADVPFSALTGQQAPRISDHWCNKSPNLLRLRQVLSEAMRPVDLPHGIGRWNPFNAAQSQLMHAAYEADLEWCRAGAGGLATYIEHAPLNRANQRARGKMQNHRSAAAQGPILAASLAGGRLDGKY